MIPKHSCQATPSPDQIVSAGYRDGLNRRPKHPQFGEHLSYLYGYAAGLREAASQLSASPPQPVPLVAFSRNSVLGVALRQLQSWEDDRDRLGFGTVALGFHQDNWTVLISQDLFETVLPF